MVKWELKRKPVGANKLCIINTMISIIITAHNNKDFIGETINSVLNSGKDFEFEVLIGIDNCKITLKKCLELYRNYGTNLKFFYFNPHCGTYVIRNTLVKMSNYDKLLFFDSDDIMDENLIGDVILNLDNYEYVKYRFIQFNGDFKSLHRYVYGIIEPYVIPIELLT